MGNLTGKEVAQMHKDYVMQSWSKSGVDALPVEKAKGIYFWDYDGICRYGFPFSLLKSWT